VTPVERLFGRHAEMVHDDGFRLLLAANAIGALGTALVSPVLDSLTGPFGVSTAAIGLLVTAVSAPSILLIPLSGALTDRFGRKPVLVAGLCCFGSGAAIAFTTDFRVALALRGLQGVGFAGVTPVIITCLGDLYDGDTEATAQGIRFGVSGLSQALFPAIAGLVVAASWRYPFLLYMLAFPVAAAVAVAFEEPTGSDPVPDDGGPAGDDDGGPAGTTDDGGSAADYVRELGRLATRRRVLAYLLARGIVVLPFIGFLTYNSIVVSRLQGGTPGQAGLLVALFSVVYAVAATQAGRVRAAADRPTLPLVGANLLVGGGLAGFALAPSVPVAGLAVAAMGVGVGLTFSLYRTIITGLAPTSLRGGLVSVGESGGRVVATATPLVIGAALSLAAPVVGSAAALRWTVVAAGLLAAGIGVGGVVVARFAPRVSHEAAADRDV